MVSARVWVVPLPLVGTTVDTFTRSENAKCTKATKPQHRIWPQTPDS